MISQFNLYDVLNKSGKLNVSIAAVSVLLILVLLLIFISKKWPSVTNQAHNNQNDGVGFSIPKENQLFKKLNFPSNDKIHVRPSSDENVIPVAELQNNHVNINVNAIISNEKALHYSFLENNRSIVVRNRGSCASSSDSTTSGSLDEESSFLRHRDPTAKYGRLSTLQHIPQQQTVPSSLVPLPESQDCVVVMQHDQLSDIQNVVDDSLTGIVGKCGLVEVAFAYDAPVRKMTVHVLQARDIPVKDRGKPSYSQIQVVLLPGKKQKQKSKVRSGDNPHYIETFLFNRIAPEEVNNLSVRFRLYGYEKMRRHRLIGECIVSFSNINLQLHTNIWIPLEPKANTVLNAQACEVLSLSQSDSTGSIQSMQHGGVPELLLGLSYNGTTGRLSVEIIKGSYFRQVTASRAPDAYVQLLLLNSTGQELIRGKTSVRKSQTNPLFKELFMYQIPLFQLSDITLMVTVYNKKTIKKKERIGWFSLGKTNSSEEEYMHWHDMKHGKGDQLSRWHILIES